MWIVIELFNPEWPTIVTDEGGKPLLFHSQKLAEDFVADECQDGIVVEI